MASCENGVVLTFAPVRLREIRGRRASPNPPRVSSPPLESRKLHNPSISPPRERVSQFGANSSWGGRTPTAARAQRRTRPRLAGWVVVSRSRGTMNLGVHSRARARPSRVCVCVCVCPRSPRAAVRPPQLGAFADSVDLVLAGGLSRIPIALSGEAAGVVPLEERTKKPGGVDLLPAHFEPPFNFVEHQPGDGLTKKAHEQVGAASGAPGATKFERDKPWNAHNVDLLTSTSWDDEQHHAESAMSHLTSADTTATRLWTVTVSS